MMTRAEFDALWRDDLEATAYRHGHAPLSASEYEAFWQAYVARCERGWAEQDPQD